VLYARDGALPPETAAALVEARVAHVLLLGGALPVAPTLRRMGISSQVLAMDDGPATSAAIGALETFVLGWAPHKAVLARGDTFPDALAAGQLAGSAHVPLIVTEGTGNLGAPAEDYLRVHGPLSTLDIVGDPSAITPTAALDAVTAGDCCKG
jgi:hypothetical protein